MPLSRADIETAYKLALDRAPSPQELANIGTQHSTLASLRQILLNSEEFYRKFKNIRSTFEDRQSPILVHMHIRETTPPVLATTLAEAAELQPEYHVDAAGFEALCALPRPERLQIRYIHGELGVYAGNALALPWRRLCILRRPGPRLYQLYKTASQAEAGTRMTFGTFLDYALHSTPHRTELDNGQMRRLAGRTGAESLGKEGTVLRQALHNALSHDTILGFYEHPDQLINALADHDFMTPKAVEQQPAINTQDDDYTAALGKLTPQEREIFDGYTAWDTYLYDVCHALLCSPTE